MLKKQFFIAILLFITSHQLVAQKLSFESLTCDAQTKPTAIESEQPSFSWVVKASGFNKSQSAYQILVASSIDKLNEKDADLWNSNKVSSSKSVYVKYIGKDLKPTQKYYWKVKIWDEKGQVSNWSSVTSFQMGLIDTSNWGDSKWISLNKDTRTSPHRFRKYQIGRMKEPEMVAGHAAAYFRNVFTPKRKIKSAQAYICGLGYYEWYINGKKVGNHVLDPAPSNYDKQAYYVHYDVTKELTSGKNAIGIVIGNGFYGQDICWRTNIESENNYSYGQPSVRLLIKVTYDDGSQANFYTDESWKESTGPIVFNNVYGGDTYDARYEIANWNTINFNDAQWGKVKVVSPEVNKISAQQFPPIRKLKELEPQNIFKGTNGNWIVDFGQNIAGWVKINVKGEKGQVIEITTTEALTPNGKDIFPGTTAGKANGMRQFFKYICKGEGVETWEPQFSYHGFRYAELKGITTKPDATMIKAILVATDLQENGSFSCSEPLFNKMHSVSKWTIVDNMHGIPEDCPHREKNGWLGDAHAYCEYALYNYDMLNFYKKFMEDIRTQMVPVKANNNKQVTHKVPTMIAPGKRTSGIAKLDWGVATMYLPWYNYLYYGDDLIVKEYYEEMKDLTEYYLSFKDEKGIIQNGMGDWCPPAWSREKNPSAMECDPIISANAYFYDVLGIMEKFAEMNNDPTFEQKVKSEKEKLFTAFNTEFLTTIPSTQFKWYGSQTATVMALQFGMVAESDISAVVNGLEYNISVIKGGHHATGIHGNRYIYTVLSNYGKANLAHEILTTPIFPSQTFIMNFGFTTWPERQIDWNIKFEDNGGSLNHPMHSGFAAYFYESLGGIKPIYSSPGFKEFTVNPQFSKNITSSSVTVPTPYGSINNSWKLTGSNFSMTLEVPFNTKARLVLSTEELKSLKINGEKWGKFQQQNQTKIGDKYFVLGSGNYSIEYPKTEN
ncbi:family 78 glycoside hydrolase catalytic domain [Flavobacterium faecale]|uniref:family 78 glycoside hydrolase catalytic domain n=1 Tax=Flavobacterium faecale TaxID=1355330 RepID=UPI003AAE2BA4